MTAMGDDWGASVTGMSSVQASFDSLEDRWGGTAEWVVGTDVSYAVHVEFGTSRMDAQPYLRPAVREVVERQGDRIAEESSGVDDLIRRLALAIEAKAKSEAPVDTGNLRASITAERIQ